MRHNIIYPSIELCCFSGPPPKELCCFFKTTKNLNMLDSTVNLITLENQLDKIFKSLFNPLADIISNEEDKQKERHFSL